MSGNIDITKDGVTVQDGRITVNIGSGNGTSSFTIENVNRTDSGSYTVNVTTTAGSDTAVVNLDVYCELRHKFIQVYEILFLSVRRSSRICCSTSSDAEYCVY